MARTEAVVRSAAGTDGTANIGWTYLSLGSADRGFV
jgi:hypothetical protein